MITTPLWHSNELSNDILLLLFCCTYISISNDEAGQDLEIPPHDTHVKAFEWSSLLILWSIWYVWYVTVYLLRPNGGPKATSVDYITVSSSTLTVWLTFYGKKKKNLCSVQFKKWIHFTINYFFKHFHGISRNSINL